MDDDAVPKTLRFGSRICVSVLRVWDSVPTAGIRFRHVLGFGSEGLGFGSDNRDSVPTAGIRFWSAPRDSVLSRDSVLIGEVGEFYGF